MSESSEELEARIAAYIDGQLPPSEAARLEVFLANTDPQLAEQIIGMLSDRHHLRALPKGVAPPDLAARVMEQVERATLLNDVDQGSHGRRWWQPRRLGAVAAVLMVGAFTYFVVTAVMGPGHDQKIGSLVLRDHQESDRAANRQMPEAGRPAGSPVDALGAGGSGGGGFGGAVAPAMSKSSDGAVDRVTALASAARKGGPESEAFKAVASERQAAEEKSPEQVEASVQEQLVRSRDVSQNGKALARKLGYTPVDSADKAFASLSVGSATAGEPVVVTLVARDEQDFVRLRQALVELMNQDLSIGQRQVALQARYLNIANNAQQLAGINGQANGNVFANNVAAGPANLRGGNTLQDQTVTNASSNTTSNTGLTSNTVAQQAVKDNVVSNITGNAGGEANRNNDALYQFYNLDQRRFDFAPESNAVAVNGIVGNSSNNGTAANQTQALGGTQAAEKAQPFAQQIPQAGRQDGAAPSYRVALRPEHLRRLAAEFQVNSVTCGQQAFVIADEPRRAVARANAAREDADKAKKELEAIASQGNADSSHQLAPAPAVPGAAATSPTAAPEAAAQTGRDMRTAFAARAAGEEPQNRPTSAAQAIGGIGGGGGPARDGRWLECVITMEPRPAKEQGEAVPATQRAK